MPLTALHRTVLLQISQTHELVGLSVAQHKYGLVHEVVQESAYVTATWPTSSGIRNVNSTRNMTQHVSLHSNKLCLMRHRKLCRPFAGEHCSTRTALRRRLSVAVLAVHSVPVYISQQDVSYTVHYCCWYIAMTYHSGSSTPQATAQYQVSVYTDCIARLNSAYLTSPVRHINRLFAVRKETAYVAIVDA
eukprot:13800-Heterococcus_DN1.PRE.2